MYQTRFKKGTYHSTYSTLLLRSRENSGQQTARQFSGQFMSDQFQQVHNQDMGSVELTHGYDMDGHANMASALQVSLKKKKNVKFSIFLGLQFSLD